METKLDIVDKLRHYVTGEYDIRVAADEIERLRQQNAELVEALRFCEYAIQNFNNLQSMALNAIAKATGGK
jgi:hypothetical protein